MSVKVQKITEPVLLGEGPHWDEKQQALYFVSIQDKTIHKYVPATGAHTRTKVGKCYIITRPKLLNCRGLISSFILVGINKVVLCLRTYKAPHKDTVT